MNKEDEIKQSVQKLPEHQEKPKDVKVINPLIKRLFRFGYTIGKTIH